MSHDAPSFPRQNIAFYTSPPHNCGYLPGRSAVTAFADPDTLLDTATYSGLAEIGFRRSGAHVYRPHCPDCQACVAARIPVVAFRPNRSQRRVLRQTPALEVHILEPSFRDEQFALYQRYITARHLGGGMDDTAPDKYLEFLASPWSRTEFVEFRHHGQLLAVAVTDVLNRGLSCVYTFFDPDFTALSPGRQTLLWQIAETHRRGLSHLYTGYWIDECRKMQYKQEYRPFELFLDNRWQRFGRDQALPCS
jgi:arginine-tRNA-protein transferase